MNDKDSKIPTMYVKLGFFLEKQRSSSFLSICNLRLIPLETRKWNFIARNKTLTFCIE